MIDWALGDAGKIALLTLTSMVPIVLASVGEIIGERAGVVNIGLEGIMLLSAWTGIVAAIYTGSVAAGYAVGALTGGLLGLAHGVLAARLKGDQIVAGVGLNLVAAGSTVVGTVVLWGNFAQSPTISGQPGVVVSGVRISPMVPLSILAAVAAWWLLNRTVTGLRIRAVGDDPRSALALGVNVEGVQIAASTMAGVMAGLAGAYLSVDYQGSFVRLMTAGRGFIALANVAFSGWNPLLAVAGSFIFGFFDALAIYIKIAAGLTAESYLVQTLPYIATIAAVALVARRGRAPRWLGRPFRRE